jgi:hypothetical protein
MRSFVFLSRIINLTAYLKRFNELHSAAVFRQRKRGNAHRVQRSGALHPLKVSVLTN